MLPIELIFSQYIDISYFIGKESEKRMRSKSKKIALPALHIEWHPLLHSLTQDDRFQLTQLQPLDDISAQHLQSLLDLHPIPVTCVPNTGRFHCLIPIPLIERLGTHPQRANLRVSLLIYNDADVHSLLTSFLLFEPAFALSTHSTHTSNVYQRLRQFKTHGLPAPSKRNLAALAQCSPSAFR